MCAPRVCVGECVCVSVCARALCVRVCACVRVCRGMCVFFSIKCCSTCRKIGRLTEVSYLSTALLYCVNMEKCMAEIH